MNRELKFRIWYYDQKKFDFNVELKDFSKYSFPLYWCKVQQYTGLKDKNGKEIYEGDILKYSDLYYEVIWADYQWIATCPYYHRYHWPKFEYFGREARSSIVSGNIFENPELLKTNE